MSQVIQISLDDLGRILIPEPLRRRLGLKPGMTLVVEDAEQEGVQLRVQEESTALVDEGGILVNQGEPLADFTDITRHERDQRVLELTRRIGL